MVVMVDMVVIGSYPIGVVVTHGVKLLADGILSCTGKADITAFMVWIDHA